MIPVVTGHNFFKAYHDLLLTAREIVHRHLPVGATPRQRNALIVMRERLVRAAREVGYVSKVHMNKPKSRQFHFKISFGPEILASGPLPCWAHPTPIIEYSTRRMVDGWLLHAFLYCTTLRNGEEETKIIVAKTGSVDGHIEAIDIAVERCLPGHPPTVVEVDGCLRIEIWSQYESV